MFREGKINTLVSTCIGEEGLDIPDVRKLSFVSGPPYFVVSGLPYFVLSGLAYFEISGLP